MGKIDPIQERQRLAKLYSEMGDGELEKIGKDPRTLTEWARDALREEMIRRGLEWQEPVEVPIFEMPEETNLLVLLRSYSDVTQAASDKETLSAAGLHAHFFSGKADPEKPFSWLPSDGVSLLVAATDLAIALELLGKQFETNPGGSAIQGETASAHEPTTPIVLRSYRDITEAMVDRSTLESAGIQCFLYDDNLVRLDWLISNAIGGVKLVVSEKEAREAMEILMQTTPPPPTPRHG